MRKKIERLERRGEGVNKEVEQPKITNKAPSNYYQNSVQKLGKVDIEEDDWNAIKKHPVTRTVVIVGVLIGVVYMSTHVFNLAAKAATSYKKFRKALEG